MEYPTAIDLSPRRSKKPFNSPSRSDERPGAKTGFFTLAVSSCYSRKTSYLLPMLA